MTDQRRRKTDQGTDVTNLLLSADTLRDREFVAAMINLSKESTANTVAMGLIVEQLTELRAEFADHKKILAAHAAAEEALINKGRGVAWIAPLVFLMAQGIVIYLWKDIQTDVAMLSEAQREDIKAHTTLDRRVTVIEQNSKNLMELHK